MATFARCSSKMAIHIGSEKHLRVYRCGDFEQKRALFNAQRCGSELRLLVAVLDGCPLANDSADNVLAICVRYIQ